MPYLLGRMADAGAAAADGEFRRAFYEFLSGQEAAQPLSTALFERPDFRAAMREKGFDDEAMLNDDFQKLFLEFVNEKADAGKEREEKVFAPLVVELRKVAFAAD